ncbi:MAG: hypothetical protein NXI10_08730 [bacterium]|nr:hypothetical protein [bacterium]
MTRSLLIIFLAVSIHHSAQAQYRRDLGKEMDRLDADVALVLRRSLDYLPIWSENSDTIYVNVLDQWYAMALRASLVETEIRGVPGGFNQVELLEPVSSETIASFQLDNYMRHVRGDTLDNIEATLTTQGFSSILTINVNGKEFYRQQSVGEEYLFPVISPDKKYVAFITVMNGLMIVKLPGKKSRVSKAEQLLNKGINAMNENNCEVALENFNASLEKDSTNGAALHNKACCLLTTGKLDELITTLNIAERLDPGYFENRELRAAWHYHNQEYDQAIDLYKQLIEEQPYYTDTYYSLIATYEEMEDYDSICIVIEQLESTGVRNKNLKEYFADKCP